MKCKTLINIIGKYNHYNILAAFNLRPERIVFIRFDEDEEKCEDTMNCIVQKLPNIEFIVHVIKDQSAEVIRTIINKYDAEGTFINLSGSNKLIGLLALHGAMNSNIVPIYIDNDEGKIIKFSDKVEQLMPLDIALTVEDIVCSSGAEILKHSTEMYDKKEFKNLVDYMIKNYQSWTLAKVILRNSYLVTMFPNEPLLVQVSADKLSDEQLRSMGSFLQELSVNQLISDYGFYIDFIEFTFTHKEAKAFVMTAGCWLEAITYRCVKELKEVNDAISGMLFVWDEEIQVHNELDVVASIDSHLVCISCKDTEKYDVEDLNELEVYADHLGGRKVVKILVSTQQPERGEMTLQRAEEMGIHIVLFKGDLISFKNKLHSILMN